MTENLAVPGWLNLTSIIRGNIYWKVISERIKMIRITKIPITKAPIMKILSIAKIKMEIETANKNNSKFSTETEGDRFLLYFTSYFEL